MFRLATASGEEITVAERLLPLEGGRNFRDLGGYATQDGRRVKWGAAYRSGSMAALTPADKALLNALGIATICDFRANEERLTEPTDVAGIHPDLAYLTRDYSARQSATGLAGALQQSDMSPPAIAAAMRALYADLAYVHAESFSAMFRAIAAGRTPLAFNCSAGKDRTGVAAALLLTLLGVDRETVVADYALSELVVDYEATYAAARAAEDTSAADRAGPYAWIASLSAEQRAPLLRSDPDYIRHALAEVERREGSLEAYFTGVLALSEADVAAVRTLMLE